MEDLPITGRDGQINTLEHLIASGEILAAQLPSPTDWSPEKRLAGAVLMSALVEIRDRHADRQYRRRVAEDLLWVFSDDVDWPFSFVRLCQLFDLEPAWVREVVIGWQNGAVARVPRQSTRYCHAA